MLCNGAETYGEHQPRSPRTALDLNKEENKMGRPIKKSKIGQGSGKIQVSSYRFAGETETQADGTAYIVSQRSTKRFKVAGVGSDSAAKEEVLTLVNKSQGALAEGEFIVNAKDESGTLEQVTKFFNNTVSTEDGSAVNKPYTISDANAADATVRTVDSQ